MACYLLLNYFSRACDNVHSAPVRLSARGWRNVDSMAGILSSRPRSGSQEEEMCSGNRTPIAREGAKQRGEYTGSEEETLRALRYCFYKPRVKGGVMTGK